MASQPKARPVRLGRTADDRTSAAAPGPHAASGTRCTPRPDLATALRAIHPGPGLENRRTNRVDHQGRTSAGLRAPLTPRRERHRTVMSANRACVEGSSELPNGRFWLPVVVAGSARADRGRAHDHCGWLRFYSDQDAMPIRAVCGKPSLVACSQTISAQAPAARLTASAGRLASSGRSERPAPGRPTPSWGSKGARSVEDARFRNTRVGTSRLAPRTARVDAVDVVCVLRCLFEIEGERHGSIGSSPCS
jgi:hypothetical protein